MLNVLLWVLAAGAVLGGADLLIGNKLGLGERFEEAFRLLGPTALSMAGILCLAPLVSRGLELTAAPLWRAMGLDAAMLGGVLAIDMGGFQMAAALAESAEIARYAGILVAATLGCTVCFTVPLGLGIAGKDSTDDLLHGAALGLCVLPAALLVGGLLCGMRFVPLLVQTLPVIVLALILVLGLRLFPRALLAVLIVLAKLIRLAALVGLILGAVQFITGYTVLRDLAPLEEAMSVVAGICVVMLGSLPLAELLRRALRKPFSWLGRKWGLDEDSLTALLIGFVSVTPALAMFAKMNGRGRVVNAAFLICGASTLAAHLGFTLNAAREMALPLLATKLLGGILGAALALIATRNKQERKTEP